MRAPTSSSAVLTRGLLGRLRPGIAGAVALGVVAALLPAAGAQAAAPAIDGTDAHPTFLNKTHYTGEFHSHTSISDGVELPEDAYTFVAENTDVDFFSASEHDVTMDVRSADDWIEHHEHAHSDEWKYLKSGAERHNESGDGKLIAVPGEEVTWYDATGHINLFNAEWFVTAPGYVRGSGDGLGGAFPVGDFMYDLPTFYARLALDPEVIGQFNHPSPNGKGNFDNFTHLTREADERMSLFEHKGASYDGQWQLALDSGWHLAPVFNGDEHGANWVAGNPALTGVWADEKSLDAVHRAMRERSMYSTLDENAILAFSGNDQMMGAVLSDDTDELDVVVQAADPDAADSFTSIQIISNAGRVAHDFGALSGNVQDLAVTLDVADGDYYFVKATQADGAQLVSAPIWIGDTVRGANYAPEITIDTNAPELVAEGERVEIPRFSAVDDSGKTPTTTVEVYNSEHLLPVTDGEFAIEGYDDHFIVIKATDGDGSTSAKVHRIQVRDTDLDPEQVFRHLGAVATVGAEPGEAGLSVATDVGIENAWAKITPVGSFLDLGSKTIASSNDRVFELDSIATEAETYLDSITAHALRSHEFDLTELQQGTRYEYRFGVGEGGPWTDVRGEFVAGGAEDAPVYVLGDVQVGSGEKSDFELPARMLDQLREQRAGGETVIQVGDLVDNAGNASLWQGTFDYSLRDLDLQFATMVGNHETYGDREVGMALSSERNRIFTSMYDLPKNGSAVGESNYSFDRGSIHFSVLNSNYDLDTQLAWLEEDVRSNDAEWHVVMGHFPYYGGRHSSDAGMSIARAKVTQTLDQLGVGLYIGGHDHVYKRGTILDGALVTDDSQRDLGTTFITMGSSGPKFYDNQVQWWDDKVFDVDTQTGLVLEAADGELQARVYTIDGELVDEFAVDKPESMFRVTSHDVVDGELSRIGVLSTDGAPNDTTLVAAAYDLSGEQLLDVRTVTAELDHRGIEQLVTFESPLPVRSDSTIRLFAWDGLASGQPLTPAILVREGMPGEGTAESPYELRTWADIEKIVQAPDAHYALMNDVALDGAERTQVGAGATPFAGVFDGRGHTVSGFAAEPSSGSGLFQTNEGTIHDLAVVEADITAVIGTAGILADVNNGTIERSWTSGSISAPARAGGLVGDSAGTIKDSYSTARVQVSGTESGGLIGVALGGSVTENVYASGAVAADTRNTGGIVGYGYNETAIRNAMSLNIAVTAPSYAHAVLGRVLSSQQATLENNHASDETFVSAESLADAPAADNLKGARVPASTARTVEHFATTLGWDLDGVWAWNADAERPVLRSNPEEYSKPTPELPTNEEGFFEIATAEDLRLIDEFPTERFVLTSDIALADAAFTSLASLVPFSGELDGAGHAISGLQSETGGLFNLNGGHIHDLGIEGAKVSSTVARAGILANVSTGLIERVYTTGEISGLNRVGGILGDSSGEFRDAYTTASVHGSSTEVGGAVGVALAGSLSERVYATGTVAADARNTGGVFGYAYTGTVIRNSVSLAQTVTAPSWAHRFLGRVLAGNTATLENNWASVDTTAETPTDTAAPSTTNLHGGTATAEQLASFGFYLDTLGFDANIWQWGSANARPLLSGVGESRGLDEDDEETPEVGPNLDTDEDGVFLVDDAADFAEIGTYPAESYRLIADVDLTGTDARIAPVFSGTFDGDGHTVTGYRSETGGLFAEVTGTVRKLALVDAEVVSTASEVGLLVDRLAAGAAVAEVRTSGSISGAATVGGIVGYLYGTISDSSSDADVTANAGRQAGGVAGIAGRGSLTQRVYAAGAVEVIANQNAGGVVGYSYATTTVVQSVALNSAITASSHAGRIAARELGTEHATFVDNLAVDSIVITGQTVTDQGRQTRNGETISADAAHQQSTYEAIGWDFASVWAWDATASRPVLVNAR
ncbi:metallophosphoesterase [Microbacterium sp. A196]|uniref:metallophosphoesterase n=1 Tax=Microbacterium sp. A196 TaxID=3457320 RepID=UPI003FD5E722